MGSAFLSFSSCVRIPILRIRTTAWFSCFRRSHGVFDETCKMNFSWPATSPKSRQISTHFSRHRVKEMRAAELLYVSTRTHMYTHIHAGRVFFQSHWKCETARKRHLISRTTRPISKAHLAQRRRENGSGRQEQGRAYFRKYVLLRRTRGRFPGELT